MPFAPHEIENKRFVVALRGYQTDEVDAFLRAVAADYRAALEKTENDGLKAGAIAAEVDRLMQTPREQAEREAAELRARAQEQVAELRKAATAHLQEERTKAEAEIAALREAALREAAEIRAAAFYEAEEAYAQITRQADALRRLEASLWTRVNVLEHTVMECRQTLSHVSNFEPMQESGTNPRPFSTNTLPTVDELLYRVEAASLGAETNTDVATADR